MSCSFDEWIVSCAAVFIMLCVRLSLVFELGKEPAGLGCSQVKRTFESPAVQLLVWVMELQASQGRLSFCSCRRQQGCRLVVR